MNGPAYRAGVMRITKELAPFGARGLPPEHRLAAVKDLPALVCEDWLIEGPTMPQVPASGVLLSVEMLVTIRQGTEGRVGVFANWRHDPTWRWTVGVWPSMAEFRSEQGLA